MNPFELFMVANLLANQAASDAFLRRAVSTMYYAIFHAICIDVADLWIGADEASRLDPAWLHVYRSVNHGALRKACNNEKLIRMYPPQCRRLAEIILFALEDRHEADYNPYASFKQSEVKKKIIAAEKAIQDFLALDISVRRSFLAHLVLSARN